MNVANTAFFAATRLTGRGGSGAYNGSPEEPKKSWVAIWWYPLATLSAIITLLMVGYVFYHQQPYCGTITYTAKTTHHHKNNTYDDPLWVIQFEVGQKHSFRPSWVDFSSYDVGSKVCVPMKKRQMEGHNHDETIFTTLALITISMIVFMIPWLFENADKI